LKVLLTGASGFVGSHVLDQLRVQGVPVVLLLRPSSSRRFIQNQLPEVEVRSGSIADAPGLRGALEGVTHVIHCAGCTKAARNREFYEVNQVGTRNMVEAANERAEVRRFIHVSSLAAGGPAAADHPAREGEEPHPVSEYGRSKLAGEVEVQKRCRAEYVILRPPAVYGPRDNEFLRIFKAVKRHVAPKPGRQPLSLVFALDLATAIVGCLDHPAAARKIYYVAAREVVTAREMAEEIAAQMKVWALPLPLPTPMFWPLCLAQQLGSYVTGRPNVLSLQKYAELRACGWVCDPNRLLQEVGYECPTRLKAGIGVTLAWYRQNDWL